MKTLIFLVLTIATMNLAYATQKISGNFLLTNTPSTYIDTNCAHDNTSCCKKPCRDQTIYPTYKIGWFEGAPDGFTRQIMGMNGAFPKVIRQKKGDRVILDIQNMVPNDTMIDIHFHGIFQKGSLLMDGVVGTSQCGPLYEKHYLYNFTTGDQVGTYWYHAHSGLEIDGLRGVLVIEDPEDPYLSPFDTTISNNYLGNAKSSLFYVDHSSIDDDKQVDTVLAVSDWHHQLGQDLFNILMTPASGGNEPVPDSALINNVGNYYCIPPNCASMYNTNIVNGKAKRFRIANTSAMALFHLTIQDHSMYVIETDGTTLEPGPAIEVLRLNPGQRYSVIVKADQNPGNYWIRAVILMFILQELNQVGNQKSSGLCTILTI